MSSFFIVFLVNIAIFSSSLSAQALGIAAIVNEEIVSAFDVENRLRFTIMSANLTDNKETRRRLKPQVIATLIDESLQIQEAKRLRISIQNSEILEAKRVLEEQNGLPSGSLASFLKVRNLEENTLSEKIKAEIAWGKIVRRRILSQIDISDEEIDEVFERIQSQRGTQQNLVSEIFLAVNNEDQLENVQRLGQKLVHQLRKGAPFSKIAKEFSQSVTSQHGGDIGWIGAGELPIRIEKALKTLEPGQVSDTILSPDGLYIIQLRDQRRLGEASPLDIIMGLKQIYIPLSPNVSEQSMTEILERSSDLSRKISDCQNFDKHTDAFEDAESVDLGKLRLGDIPQSIQEAISSLEIGQISQPLREKDGIRILMVCDRQEPIATLPDREVIRDRLGRKRLDMMARRYLRDLRHSAVIESR